MADSGSIAPVIQGIGLIVGWAVVHRLSAARDIDKARREMIGKAADSLSDEVTKLFIVAKDYHTCDRSEDKEILIKMSLQDLAGRVVLLGNAADQVSELSMCSRSVQAMRQAITGEHFEDEHAGKISLASPQISQITDEVLRAKRALQELKHNQFPPARKK
jgi:hypothetical protein